MRPPAQVDLMYLGEGGGSLYFSATMWWSKPEEPKVIKAGDRKKCWGARDQFFNCLDAHSIIDATKDGSKARKACPSELQEFENACIATWVDYFKQKRVADYTKEMRIKELEKAGYQPLNAPLQVKSVSEDEISK